MLLEFYPFLFPYAAVPLPVLRRRALWNRHPEQAGPQHYNRFGLRRIPRSSPNAKPKVYSKTHRSQLRFTPQGWAIGVSKLR